MTAQLLKHSLTSTILKIQDLLKFSSDWDNAELTVDIQCIFANYTSSPDYGPEGCRVQWEEMHQTLTKYRC